MTRWMLWSPRLIPARCESHLFLLPCFTHVAYCTFSTRSSAVHLLEEGARSHTDGKVGCNSEEGNCQLQEEGLMDTPEGPAAKKRRRQLSCWFRVRENTLQL